MMLTKYIQLIFLLFLFSCQNDKDISNKKEWISTYRDSWSDPGIYLDLSDNDTLFFTKYFEFNKLRSYKYFIDSANNLILDDTTVYGQIIKYTDDILLITDSAQTNSFIPIKNSQTKKDTSEIEKILLTNNWLVKERNDSIRLEFKEKPYYYNTSRLKMYYRIDESKGNESFDVEWWTIEKYNNSLFIILSYFQLDYQIYQVISISDSKIVTETCWNDSIENVEFIKLKKLSKNKYQKLRDNLVGTWEMIDFEEPVSDSISEAPEKEITLNSFKRNRPFIEKDSVPSILDKYYQKKTINYTFSENGECSMNTDKTNLRKANWKLSNDGKYIQTEDGWMRSMKIVSITDSILITEKHEIIEYPYKNGWTDKYIREKFKKITVPNKL
ncbi:hypothetical protein D1164_23370 [Mariniphaga sediminis]|uniref:Lipocalin-like domain-containing protein n=1 Tax=Mariniphaga sediminis TaxID=1628158 RepID=A0A399CVW0_9BACT|nr:hypothetical protein [Mariniphaga sediminis]RIH62742.1 hypothetical protein D1164_23370 [Mariniphaga sediminis]